MSLREVTLAALVVLLLIPGLAAGQGSGPPPKMTTVTEQLPWFDHPGTSFAYQLSGTTEGVQGKTTYSGQASLDVLGLASNDSVLIHTASNIREPLFPNGTLYDDPLFPSYIQVLPQAFVIPRNYTVLAPTFALTFHYLGNVSTDYHGSIVSTFAYSVSSASPSQGQSPIAKYYRVLPSNGLILQEEITNVQVGTTLNVTLSTNSYPASTGTASELRFQSPDFSAPGSYITYRNTGAANQSITYSTVFSEPDGAFVYERTVIANGSLLGSQFYADQASKPRFYPVSIGFGDTITFPLAVGSLETGILTRQGQASIKTLDGYFLTQAYANKTVGFEAYLDNSTGVAVYLELPGGVLQLSASNFLLPSAAPSENYLLVDVVPIAVVVVVALLAALHFRKAPSRTRRRRA